MKTTQKVIYVQFGAGMHNHVNVAVVEEELFYYSFGQTTITIAITIEFQEKYAKKTASVITTVAVRISTLN